jgi:hypothetical protein
MTTLDQPSTSPLVSIAIATWNRSTEVLRAIQSIYDQSYSNFEIVIVDNHSPDNTADLIEQQFPDVKVIRLHRNLGATGGRNIALANCQGDIIFNLDDDAVLKPDTLPRIVDFFATASPEVGLVACQVFEAGAFKFPSQSEASAIFEACGWAIRRTVLQKVGYFADQFFRTSEETDFALNVLSAGYQIWYLSDAIIHHMPSKVRVSEKVSFYKCRNEIIIILERYPIPLILPFIIWTLIAQLKFCLRHPSHFPHVIHGFLEALIQAPIHLSNRKPVPFSILSKVRFSPMHGSRLATLFAR